MSMTQAQEAALRSLYLMTGIPFSIISYDGSVLYSQPDEYGRFLDQEAIAEPEDTLSESEHPEGITILEFPGLFHQAILKIDDSSYVTTAMVSSSKDGRFPINHMAKVIRSEHLKEYISLITALPATGIPELINYARMIKFSLTGEYQQGVNYYKASNPGEEITPIETPAADFRKDNEESARTFRLQEHLDDIYEAVKDGNTELLGEVLHEPASLERVSLSESSLRDARYKAVMEMSVAMSAARRGGGVPEHPAVTLLSEAVKTIDLMTDELGIMRYESESILGFATLVKEALEDEGKHPYTVKAIAYIRAHIYEDISVDDVAGHCLINRNSLAAYFRRDTGRTISEYIMNEKLERGVQFLKDTDMPISEISSLLCFATQSHFTERFRVKYGITPKQLRLRLSHKQLES